jgi:hypothetical protein
VGALLAAVDTVVDLLALPATITSAMTALETIRIGFSLLVRRRVTDEFQSDPGVAHVLNACCAPASSY